MHGAGRLFSALLIWAVAVIICSAQTSPPATGREVETDFELATGGVIVDVDGSREKFRTERNLRSGFNVSEFFLDMRPAAGADTFFDFATLTAFGLGGSSPYQRADLRVGQRKNYDLRAGYRKYNYFFGLPEFALGLHPEDSIGRASHVNLKLLPDRTASFVLGYRRNQLLGTRFTTQDLRFDTFPVSYPRRLSSDQFLAGVRLHSRQASLNFDQSFIRFKNDQRLLPNGDQSIGLRNGLLEAGERNVASRISTPVSRVLGRYQPSAQYDVTGRYVYSGADADVNRYEDLLNRVGAGRFPLRQVITSSGMSEKPSHNAAVAQSVDITQRLTLHHRFTYETYTLTGFLDTLGVLSLIDEFTDTQLDLPIEEIGGTVTDYLLARNEVELSYALNRSLSLLGGYRYSDRHMAFGDAGTNPRPVVTISHSGGGGFSWVTGRAGRVRAEFEKGTASRAFNRIDPLSFLRFKVRGQHRPRPNLTISGNAVIEDNKNETPGVNRDLDNRQVGAQVVWVPSRQVAVTGAYSFLRIRSSTDIVFYALSNLVEDTSFYETSSHVVHAQVQVPIGSRLVVRGGYELLKDTGPTYPLRLHAPRAGFSVSLHRNVAFEADWRHYNYSERNFLIRDYRANVLALGLRLKH